MKRGLLILFISGCSVAVNAQVSNLTKNEDLTCKVDMQACLDTTVNAKPADYKRASEKENISQKSKKHLIKEIFFNCEGIDLRTAWGMGSRD